MSYILYGLYNIVYQVLTIWFLLLANTYYNWIFIPNSFLWKDGKPREDWLPASIMQTIILLAEVVLLMLLLFYINRRYLSGIAKADNASAIALWTTSVYGFITVVFVVFLVYTAK